MNTRPAPDIVGDEGLGDDQVGVGVEAIGQLVGVVVEVALDGETPAVKRVFAGLRGPIEPSR